MGRLLGPLLPLALILSGSLANPLKGLLDRAKEKKEGKNPAPRVIELFVSPEEARYLLERYEGLMKDSLFADGSTSGSSSSGLTTVCVFRPRMMGRWARASEQGKGTGKSKRVKGQ